MSIDYEFCAAPVYSVGSSNHQRMYLLGLNNDLKLVGNYATGTGQIAGEFVCAGGPPGGFIAVAAAFTNAYATGINDQGAVVGIGQYGADGSWQGFLSVSGAVTAINYPGAASTSPTAINDAGVIVGDYIDSDGVNHGFSYQAGVYATIDPPSANLTNINITGVNNSNQIVGYVYDADTIAIESFIEVGGSFTMLADPTGAGLVVASDINNNGVVAGFYSDLQGLHHGFTYSNGAYQTIDRAGATETYVKGVNDYGDLVGEAYYAATDSYDDFVALGQTGRESAIALMDTLGLDVSGSVSVAYFLANQAALDAGPNPFTIADTANNLSAAFDAISRDLRVGAVTITDAGAPALSLTPAQLAGDSNAIAMIANSIFQAMPGYYYVGHNGPNGASVTLAASGANVTLWAASRMDLSGSNNVVTAGTGCNFSVTGAGDSLYAGAGDGVWIGGNGAGGTADFVSGSGAVVYVAGNSNVQVADSNNVVLIDSGSNVGITGAGDKVNASAGDGVWIGGNGAGGTADFVSGSGAVVYVAGNSNVQVAGSNDVVLVSANSNVGVTGAGDRVNASAGDGVWIGGNGAGGIADSVSGSGAVVYVAGNSNVQVAGSNDVVLVSASSNVGVTGAGDRVNASAGDGVWIGGNGAGGAADFVSGSGAVVYVSGDSNVQVAGSNDVVLASAGSNVGVVGSNNHVAAGASDGLWISKGSGNIVTAGANNVLYDYATATQICVGGAIGALTIVNFAADGAGVVDLLAGVGGYATAQAAFQAVTSDGAGGSRLSLGASGSIDWIGCATLSLSNFAIG